MEYFCVMMSQRRISAIAGISLLTMAVVAGFGYGFAFERLYVAGNGDATVSRLNNTSWLLTSVIASFIIILILDVIVALALYALFKKASPLLSLISAASRLMYAAILGKAITYLVSAGHQLQDTPQDKEMVMNNLDLFLHTWSLGLIIFGIHLCILGMVLKNAGFVPKTLVFLVLFAGACYISTNVSHQLWPLYEVYRNKVDMILALPMALGEMALAVWLIYICRKKYLCA